MKLTEVIHPEKRKNYIKSLTSLIREVSLLLIGNYSRARGD